MFDIENEKHIMVISFDYDHITVTKDDINYLYNFNTKYIREISREEDSKMICNGNGSPFNRVFTDFNWILKYREAEKELYEGKRISLYVKDFCIE